MEKWIQKHNIQLDLRSESEMIKQINQDILLDKYIQNIDHSKYMFSDVSYADEQYAKNLNLSSNKSWETLFFEIEMQNGNKIYRTACSIDEIMAKFNNVKIIKQVSQEIYEQERKLRNWLGDDSIYEK